MATQRYSVTPHTIDTVLAWVRSGEIAIPEIQRPFVWDARDVRSFLDSLYQGYPVGYLITWRNPTVKLKDGTLSTGKRILVDGQQRITALMAALLGREVLTKDYRTVRIHIAFDPIGKCFEVSNPAIEKDHAWISDIAALFGPSVRLLQVTRGYARANPGVDEDAVHDALENLCRIVTNQFGVIELADDLDIETVAEIFERVNSAGVRLSQADFAMSRIAVNDTFGGSTLRKAIDYFCHMAVVPDFHGTIVQNDPAFARTSYFSAMSWLRNDYGTIYDPSYTDMLRVAFTSEFRRGRLQDLVALLSGRNFETKQCEEAVIEDSFTRLKSSAMRFMNEEHFNRFVMIIRSAGFVDASMISSQNALNVGYMLYLTLRDQHVPNADIERYVRRWFVMSVLTGRYSGSAETSIDYDIRQIDAQGIVSYAAAIEQGELSDAYWEVGLPQVMDTSVASSPYFRVYQAAQVKANDRGFLSRDITVRELVEVRSDVHHIFPRGFLKQLGMSRGQYNQIANYVVAQSEINIAIGAKEPRVYFAQLSGQCSGGKKIYGNITDPAELTQNLRMNCIPEGMEHMTAEDYPEFLALRRRLMAQKIRAYFESL